MLPFTYLTVFTLQLLVMSAIHFSFNLSKVAQLVNSKKIFFLLLALVLFIQVFFSSQLVNQVGDVMLFEGAGYHYRFNSDFYFIDADHSQYPFFPFLIFLHALLNSITSQQELFTFSFYLKLVMMPLLIGMGYLVTHKVKGMDKINSTQKRQLLLSFLTHPITTLVVFFHGQVDVFLLFFLIVGCWLLFSYKELKWWLLGATALMFSVASKTWSVITLPYIWLQQEKLERKILLPLIIVLGLMTIIFIYTRTVFGSSFSTIIPALTKPGGPIGIWGVTILPQIRLLAPDVLTYSYLVFLGLLSLFLWWKKFPQWVSLLLIVLGAVIITPRFGFQYLFWFLPFLYAIKKTKTVWFNLYTILGAVYGYLYYLNDYQKGIVAQPIVLGFGLLVWLILVKIWLLVFQKNHNSTKGAQEPNS